MARRARRTFSGLGCLDLENLELHLSAWFRDLNRLTLLLPDDRLADPRLVGELVLRRVGLGRADDVVSDGLLGADVAQLHLRADRDDVLGDVLLRDDAGVAHPLLERCDAVLEQHLLVLGVVVFGVLRDVAELPRNADPLGNLAAFRGRELLDFALQLLEALGCENHFLHLAHAPLLMKKARRRAPSRAPIVATLAGLVTRPWRDYFPLCAGRSPRILVDRVY